MPTEAKRETVAELREELANARTMIVSEYRGLKVKEIAEIRRALRKQDVTYRVVKNRLMRIAAEDSVGEALEPVARSDRPRSRSGPTRRAPPRPSSTPPGRTHASSGSPAACSATGRSVPRTSPAWPHCRRARSCWPSWPAGCRRRSARWPGCFAAPLRNLGYALQQVAEQKAAGQSALPLTDSPRPFRPTPTKEITHGCPDPGRSARSDRQDDRARAVRVHQALRGALRRDRGRSGRRRGRPGRRWRCRRSRRRARGADRVHRDPDRDRARTRSRSSRSCAS